MKKTQATASQITGSELWQVEINRAVIFQGTEEESKAFAEDTNRYYEQEPELTEEGHNDPEREKTETDEQVNAYNENHPPNEKTDSYNQGYEDGYTHGLRDEHRTMTNHMEREAEKSEAKKEKELTRAYQQGETEGYTRGFEDGSKRTPADKIAEEAWAEGIENIAQALYLNRTETEARNALEILRQAKTTSEAYGDVNACEAAKLAHEILEDFINGQWAKEEQAQVEEVNAGIEEDETYQEAYQATLKVLQTIDPGATQPTEEIIKTALYNMTITAGARAAIEGTIVAAEDHANTNGKIVTYTVTDEDERQLTEDTNDYTEAELWEGCINHHINTTIRATIEINPNVE